MRPIRLQLGGSMRIAEAINLEQKISLLDLKYISESVGYDKVPKSQMSVRFDKGNTNKKTQDHAHVFARPNGQGKHLFAVNVDGTGHDGSSGKAIPKKVGNYLNNKGYAIPPNFVIESMSLSSALEDRFIVFIVYEQ